MSDKDDPFGSKPSENPFGSPPGGDPFGGAPSSGEFGPPSSTPAPGEAWRQPAPHDPFSEPPAGGPGARAEGAIAALVLGIVGLVICPLCAPFAWAMGSKAEQAVDASGGRLTGRGEATAGKVLGMVACGLMVLGIVLLLVVSAATVSTI